MSEQFPEFSSEQELIEWFENADLSRYELAEALEVTISTRVALSLSEPWTQARSGSSSTGTAGRIESRGLSGASV